MLLKRRYELGSETLCREVADSISWQRFCRHLLRLVRVSPVDAGEPHHPLRRCDG